RLAVVRGVRCRLLGVANLRRRARRRLLDPALAHLADQIVAADAGATLELAAQRIALALDVVIEPARAIAARLQLAVDRIELRGALVERVLVARRVGPRRVDRPLAACELGLGPRERLVGSSARLERLAARRGLEPLALGGGLERCRRGQRGRLEPGL